MVEHTCHPSYTGNVQVSLDINTRPYLKNDKSKPGTSGSRL
jgi:hypothetical protein